MVVQEVVKIRSVQKRVGSRKLHHLLEGFRAGHSIKMGRDGLNELLREHSMLIRKRRRKTPPDHVLSPLEAVSEPYQGYRTDACQPGLGERYNVCASERGLCVSEPDHGCVFAKDSGIPPEPGPVGKRLCNGTQNGPQYIKLFLKKLRYGGQESL